MSRWEAWFVHVANLLVGTTGVAYAVTRYWLAPDDPFAAAHPWQSPVQHLHILTAPLLVFAIGLIFRSHAWLGVQLDIRPRRRSGISLIALATPMIASGYLLQIAVEPAWRTAWAWIHGVTAALWIVATLVHQLVPKSSPQPG